MQENGDIQTSHDPKLVRNSSHPSALKITDILTLEEKDIYGIYAEVSFNRRYRNHEKVNNKNKGGSLIPDAYGIDNIEQLTEDVKEFCRKYKIPVYYVHREKYIEKEQQNENEKEEGR